VCVNFTFRLPLQYYSRRLLYKQAKLNPLVTAWTSRHAAVVPAAEGSQTKFMRDVKLAGLVERSRSRIYKTWGVQRWKAFAPLLGFFPFVVVSESLRRLCGAPTGALSHALGAGTSSSTDNVVSSSLFDASLSQGGSLWFADLTAMDPYFVLPVLCSAILARNSWFKMSTERLRDLLSLDNSGIRQAPIVMLQKALGRALLAVPLFPLLFADLPSAIFLYWAASFSLTQVNDVLLEKLIPKPKKPERIRPPLRPVLPFLRNTSQIASKK
jgi:inner membrane protein COX18